jgi:hypothetical protein
MKKVLVVVVATVAVCVAIYYWFRRSDTVPKEKTPVMHAPPSPTTAPASQPSPPSAKGAHKLTEPGARDRLLDAIRTARAQRTAGPVGQTGPGVNAAPPTVGDQMLGEVGKDFIRHSVREINPLLAECYTNAIHDHPALQGKVVVKFTIEGEPGVGGVIGTSQIASHDETLGDPDFLQCLQETMYAIQIDPPSDGGVVNVTYPFEFSSEPPEDGGP